ncbi:MAG: OmpA family protein [Flavobacteriales bacterium]|nr:PD40 domain-containing protein [Flavobacteriales bacterium]
MIHSRGIALLFVLGVGLSASAQTRTDAHVNEADRYFHQMAYALAVEEYRIAAEMGAVNEHVTKRLAECYLRLGDTQEAERWYATVVKFLNREPRDLFNYAEALKGNGRYEEAEEWMDKYLALVNVDGGPKRSNISGFAKKLTQDVDRFVVRPVSINSAYSDFGVTMLPDGRALFSSARNETIIVERRAAWNDQPFLDIYSASVGPDGDLRDPQLIEGSVNSKLHEGPASASLNGNVLWFTRNRAQKGKDGINRLGIYKAHEVDGKWGGIEQFLFNDPEVSIGHPSLSADGKRLYFVSDMPGGFGGTDIYVSHEEGGQWSEPENLGPSVNTPHHEVFPFISATGTLYFSSNGHPGLGGLDILAARQLPDGGFKPAMNLGAPVNGPKDDFAFVIDPQGKKGYFASNRPGGAGDDDIYAFEMVKALEERFLCTGAVIDDEYETPVIAAEVQLFDANDVLLASTYTDARGEYSFPVEKDKAYRLVAKMQGRFDGEQHLSTERIEREQIVARDIHLVVDAGVWMRGAVSRKGSISFIPGMSVSVVNLSSYYTENQLTGPGGDFSFRLQSNEEFEVLFEKEGYFSQSVPVSTIGMKQGVIDLNQARELEFEPVVLDSAIALKYIRWAGSGTALDPVARTELDGLVERMLVNPRIVIEIGVHTDARGTLDKQQPTTQKQAEAVLDYLQSKGVPKERVVARGYGSSHILNHCVAGVQCTEEEHAVNRRTEYKVIEIRN